MMLLLERKTFKIFSRWKFFRCDYRRIRCCNISNKCCQLNTAAANSATAAAASESAAQTAQAAAEAALDTIDDDFLGSKASDPTLDNDGNALADTALYFNTTDNVMKVYDLGNTYGNN